MMYRTLVPLFSLLLAALPTMGWANTKTVTQVQGVPHISGHPTINNPPLLAWPRDRAAANPDLTDPEQDRLYDLHGDIGGKACAAIDLVFSTEGNYNMALHDMWYKVLLPKYGKAIESWYYTTSPPISLPQIEHRNLSIGNLYLHCVPSVAVAGMRVVKKMKAKGLVEGKPIEIMRTRGNVLLVKHGNPKHIHSIWDLGRPDVHLVTPNPYNEGGAFRNYVSTIYNIAKNDPNPPKGWTADRLFNAVFNSGVHGKWLSGGRIHHRHEPWAVAHGKADVAVIMYQLGNYTQQTFPSRFDIISLGGKIHDPQPLPGNFISKAYLVKIRGHWTHRQLAARRDLIKTFESGAFTHILSQYGLRRP